jgi:hypothetical protein
MSSRLESSKSVRRLTGTGTKSPHTARRSRLLRLEVLEERALPSAIGDVFYIDMENHNLTQPSSVKSPAQLQGNPAAPFLNSLITPGDPNAAQTSYASNYLNVISNGTPIHPSEPNYAWQQAGLTGPLNDSNPYPNNIVNAPSLSALLQAQYGTSGWKSYQEDIDLTPNSGSVNQPGANSLTSAVVPQNEWTVPLKSFSGTSSAYTNPYNGSNQYAFAAKHDGQLFFTATNGGDNLTPSNPEAQYYAPLQQLQTDLTNNTVAMYNLITPDLYNDMHTPLSGGFTYNGTHYTGDQAAVAEGDNFLSIIVPQIMASQAYKNNGVIVITFDESEGGSTSKFDLPEIVISPLAQGNAYDSIVPYTHSSDLKSMEEIFGVYPPSGAFLGSANTPGTNDLNALLPIPANLTVKVSGTTLTLTENSSTGIAGITVTEAATFGDLTVGMPAGNLIIANGKNDGTSFTTPKPITAVTINLGSGPDTLTIGDPTFATTLSLPGNLTISGTGGDKTLSVDSVSLLGSAKLSVSLTGNGTDTSTFQNVDVGGNVTINATASANITLDNLNVPGGTTSVILAGSASSDTVNVQADAGLTSVYNNFMLTSNAAMVNVSMQDQAGTLVFGGTVKIQINVGSSSSVEVGADSNNDAGVMNALVELFGTFTVKATKAGNTFYGAPARKPNGNILFFTEPSFGSNFMFS